MLSDKVHFLIQSLYTFHISSGVIRQLHLLATADTLGSPVEIAHIDRAADLACNSMKTGFPTLYRLARAFRCKSKMHDFLRFHFLYHTQYDVASLLSIDRDTSKFAKQPSERSPEQFTLDHTVWLSTY